MYLGGHILVGSVRSDLDHQLADRHLVAAADTNKRVLLIAVLHRRRIKVVAAVGDRNSFNSMPHYRFSTWRI